MERRSEEETNVGNTKEKWDRVEQYLEHLRHLAAYVLLAEPFVGTKKVLEIAVQCLESNG